MLTGPLAIYNDCIIKVCLQWTSKLHSKHALYHWSGWELKWLRRQHFVLTATEGMPSMMLRA